MAAASAASPRSNTTDDKSTDLADTFWALSELQRREPTPGAVMIVGSVTLPTGGTAAWQMGAPTEELLADDWEQAAARLDALAHPVRLRILKEVLGGRSTAKELSESESVGSQGQVYHHLRALTSTGWLRSLAGGRHEVPAERIVPMLTAVLGALR